MFPMSGGQLIYDVESLPNIAPLKAMISGFKLDEKLVVKNITIQTYSVTECDKETILNLVRITNGNYNNINIQNIRNIIHFADFYVINIDYNKIKEQVMSEFINSLPNNKGKYTKMDENILCKLFANQSIAQKYMSNKYLMSIGNDYMKKMLALVCPILYYDADYSYCFVKNVEECAWIDKNKLLSGSKILTKKLAESVDFNVTRTKLEKYENIFSITIKLKNINDFPIKCVLFGHNEVLDIIIFNKKYTPGIVQIDDQTFVMTLDVTICTCIYFVYQTKQ